MQKTFILTYDEYYNHMSNLKPQMKYPKSLKKKGGGVGRQGDKRSHTYTHYVAHILKCLFRVYTLQKDFLCTHVEGREGGREGVLSFGVGFSRCVLTAEHDRVTPVWQPL